MTAQQTITEPGTARRRPPERTPERIAVAVEWVTISQAAAATGYTEKAIRRKMQEGVWVEGGLWRRAPDGRIMVNLRRYDRWVETGQQG